MRINKYIVEGLLVIRTLKKLLCLLLSFLFINFPFNAQVYANENIQNRYDENGRLIYTRSQSGTGLEMEYDLNGNLLGKKEIQNLLYNPSFETNTGTTGTADGWLTWYKAGTFAFEVVGSPVASGRRAQKMVVSQLMENGMGALHQSLVSVPNRMISGKAKVNVTEIVNARVELIVDFYDAEGRWLSNAVTSQARPTHGYINMSTGSVMVPANAATTNLQIAVLGNASGGSATVYVDMANLEYD